MEFTVNMIILIERVAGFFFFVIIRLLCNKTLIKKKMSSVAGLTKSDRMTYYFV